MPKKKQLSLVSGSTNSSLWDETLGQVIERQATKYGDRRAVVFPWQRISWSYEELRDRSKIVATSMLQAGLRKGDCVGILAGNCSQYIEVFLGATRVGCCVAVLNTTYTPVELISALKASKCKLLVQATTVGMQDYQPHVEAIKKDPQQLKLLVLLSANAPPRGSCDVETYEQFLRRSGSHEGDLALSDAEKLVRPDDVVNLQFTSGTTGAPKAAMLTHINVINNGRLIAQKMLFTEADVICCPPPLFHCFGLVIGFLASFTTGASIVFPSDNFDPNRVLDAVAEYKCTALLGVPTMFLAELDANKTKKRNMKSLRIGLAAGTIVPLAVLKRLENEMNIKDILIAYGMTETSPVTFMTSTDDTVERRLKTVGTVMEHTMAKVVDTDGEIVPCGVRGELCTSGYALQKGYLDNEVKTREVMKTDADGVRWMHTGDEAIIDEHGYCSITGRLKDLIIRGGENIAPAEIEERLMSHVDIAEASVVGLPDEKYGEVVAAFLRGASRNRPTLPQIASWVQESLGKHKAPKYAFWIGDEGIGDDFPKTGSGKMQKHLLRGIGVQKLQETPLKARL